jgi:hypothetical protein
MWRFRVIDAVLHLGVLFYRYCPLPWLRMVPLLALSRMVAAYLRWRKRTY